MKNPHTNPEAPSFSLYSSTGNLFSDLDDAVDVASSDTEKYWAYLVTSAYQPDASEDADPHSGPDSDDPPTLGETTSGPWPHVNVTGIFIESIREDNRVLMPRPLLMAAEMQKTMDGTIAHEIGHAPGVFGLDDHLEGGLMGNGTITGDFRPATLKRFRSAKQWRGQ